VPRHRNELVRALGFDPDVKRSAMIPLGSRNGKVEWAGRIHLKPRRG
jgi:hypothetical protein